MNIIELLGGKSVQLSFRAPLLIAARIEQMARDQGTSAAKLTLALWKRELGMEDEAEVKAETNGHV